MCPATSLLYLVSVLTLAAAPASPQGFFPAVACCRIKAYKLAAVALEQDGLLGRPSFLSPGGGELFTNNLALKRRLMDVRAEMGKLMADTEGTSGGWGQLAAPAEGRHGPVRRPLPCSLPSDAGGACLPAPATLRRRDTNSARRPPLLTPFSRRPAARAVLRQVAEPPLVLVPQRLCRPGRV